MDLQLILRIISLRLYVIYLEVKPMLELIDCVENIAIKISLVVLIITYVKKLRNK